ncbi:MAG: ribosome hibernation-promoting factor, HPF/YfiA family [Rhizomicrobium sp.]
MSGKQIELGSAFRGFAKERLAAAIARHFDVKADVHAVFGHDGPLARAGCTAHLYSGAVLTAEGEGKDVHLAFDAMLAHLEKQVRRYKRRLTNHHEKTRARPRAVARSTS